MTERQGVEIDYCPTCRGVWLDRGELDKIIDRVEGVGGTQPTSRQTPQQSYAPPPRQDYRRPAYEPRYHTKKRKESFLGELYDFG